MTQITQSLLCLAEQAPAPGGLSSFFVPVLLFVGMWFLLIAPQRKKQKQHAKMLEALTTGDDVITAGGIYGNITNVKEDRFVIKVSENTKIEVTKASVQNKA